MIFCGYSGTVQPQLAEASNIIRSDFPVFVKLKSTSTTSPSFTSPKSYVSKSNWISGQVQFPSGHLSTYNQAIVREDQMEDTSNSSKCLWLRLCLNCFKIVPHSRSHEIAELLSSPCMLYCGTACEKKFAVKSSSTAARRAVFRRDRGICELCKVDCDWMIRRLQAIEKETPEYDTNLSYCSSHFFLLHNPSLMLQLERKAKDSS